MFADGFCRLEVGGACDDMLDMDITGFLSLIVAQLPSAVTFTVHRNENLLRVLSLRLGPHTEADLKRTEIFFLPCLLYINY